jgi:hypothetical protein
MPERSTGRRRNWQHLDPAEMRGTFVGVFTPALAANAEVFSDSKARRRSTFFGSGRTGKKKTSQQALTR